MNLISNTSAQRRIRWGVCALVNRAPAAPTSDVRSSTRATGTSANRAETARSSSAPKRIQKNVRPYATLQTTAGTSTAPNSTRRIERSVRTESHASILIVERCIRHRGPKHVPDCSSVGICIAIYCIRKAGTPAKGVTSATNIYALEYIRRIASLHVPLVPNVTFRNATNSTRSFR